MRRYFALLAASLLVTACAQESSTPTADDSAFELQADNVAFYVQHNLTAEGVRRSRVKADTTYFFEADRRQEFRRVEVEFFQDDGQVAGTLTSDTAENDASSGLFVARGNVVLLSTSPGGGERRLETEELFFDVPNDRIWSDRPSTIVEGGQTTRVTWFKSDSQFSTWEAGGTQTQGSAEGGTRF
jgi:LPS export ABC transporter protein LptC